MGAFNGLSGGLPSRPAASVAGSSQASKRSKNLSKRPVGSIDTEEAKTKKQQRSQRDERREQLLKQEGTNHGIDQETLEYLESLKSMFNPKVTVEEVNARIEAGRIAYTDAMGTVFRKASLGANELCEDNTAVMRSENFDGITYSAMLDGHGHRQVSDVAATKLLNHLDNKLHETAEAYEAKTGTLLLDDKEAVKTFLADSIEGYDKEMQSLGLRGGACLSLLMIDKERKTFYDAGLGDTATIHFWSNDKTGAWKYNRPIKAHCSDNQDEIARITAESSYEAWPQMGPIRRINGSLAPTRAMGDFEHKDQARWKANSLGYHLLSGRPEVRATSMDQAGCTLRGTVQCCDGVTDNMTDAEIMEQFRASKAKDASSAAVDLLRGAFGKTEAQRKETSTWAPGFARNCRDDVTALTVNYNDFSTADTNLTYLKPGEAQTSAALHQLPADKWVDFAKQQSEERSKASADLQSKLRSGLESYLASQSKADVQTSASLLTGCATESAKFSELSSGLASSALTLTV